MGRKADKTTFPAPLTERQQTADGSGPGGPTSSPDSNAWTVVPGKKAKKPIAPKSGASVKKEKGMEETVRRKPITSKSMPNGSKGKGTASPREAQNGKAPRRRLPRAAAVTLTCPPDTYSEAMRTVRDKINLEDLDIPALRPKKAVTGAIILEIPGPNGAEKAAILKEKMEALSGMEGVKVARPTKTAEIRVKDFLTLLRCRR